MWAGTLSQVPAQPIYKALSELRAAQSERRKQAQAEQKAAHEAHLRRAAAEAERENETFNQQLIAMCEHIPAVPNDGHKYIQPRPVGPFGNGDSPSSAKL